MAAALWRAAQRPDVPKPPRKRPATLLGGLLRCAGCRYVVVYGRNRIHDDEAHPSYSCHRRHAPGVCPEPAHVAADVVQACVEDVYWQALAGAGQTTRPQQAHVERLQREAIEAEDESLCEQGANVR